MENSKNMYPEKLLGYKEIKGNIIVETGLHIGGSSDTIEIGGMDNPIITNPVTNEPYIPGSSLKGKMRSLLEWKYGKLELADTKKFGEPYGYHPEKAEDAETHHFVSRIFGTNHEKWKSGPTRLIVRDAFVSTAYKKKMKRNNEDWTWTDMMEEKTENAINRITARANPRPIQRVVTGTEFEFEIIFKVFDTGGDNGDVDKELFEYVIEGLQLIEKEALGGSGSRGCGKVTFKVKLNGEYKKLSDIKASDFEIQTI